MFDNLFGEAAKGRPSFRMPARFCAITEALGRLSLVMAEMSEIATGAKLEKFKDQARRIGG